MLSLKKLVLALATAQTVAAHSAFTSFFVDGEHQGNGVCVRSNPDLKTGNFPMPDVTGSEMVCGMGGTKGVERVCPVPDGATLTFEWRSSPGDGSKEAIDDSHVGPCAVYMKRVDSAVQDSGEGDGWFKIFHDGYDAESQSWCSTVLNDHANHLSVKLPDGLAGGYYLVRPELLALHAAVDGDPQFYTGCAQVFLESTGTKVPQKTVSIPGYVSESDPGMSFNVYERPMALPYPIPGPRVADLIEDSSVEAPARQTEGHAPRRCVAESGNWCGLRLPKYTDEASCWEVQGKCWDQNERCWNQLPAVGGAGCEAHGKYCEAITEDCRAGRPGPPRPSKEMRSHLPSLTDYGYAPTSAASPLKGKRKQYCQGPKCEGRQHKMKVYGGY